MNDQNPEDKRLKANDSIEIEENELSQPIMEVPEEKELTLLDINRYMDTILARVDNNRKDIQNLATKQDYIVLNDQLTSQGTEIQQLKSEI